MYRFDEATENLEEHIDWLEKKKRDTSEAEKNWTAAVRLPGCCAVRKM